MEILRNTSEELGLCALWDKALVGYCEQLGITKQKIICRCRE